jgi:hypothetical protein
MSAPLPEVHAQIFAEAKAARENAETPFSEAEGYPALLGLTNAVIAAIEDATPASIEYQGKRYWLRVRMLAVAISIHDAPTEPAPLVRLMARGKWAGHKPGH